MTSIPPESASGTSILRRPGVGPARGRSGQAQHWPAAVRTDVAAIGPKVTKVGRIGVSPKLVDFGLVDIGPGAVELMPKSAQMWPRSPHMKLTPVQYSPNLAEPKPNFPRPFTNGQLFCFDVRASDRQTLHGGDIRNAHKRVRPTFRPTVNWSVPKFQRMCAKEPGCNTT